MRVSTTKAHWFALAVCTLAQLPVACRRDPEAGTGAACAGAGIVSSRRLTQSGGAELAAEIVQSGCADCAASVRSGAPPGSACSAASVCAEFCCQCPNSGSKLRYRARVCESDVCGDANQACRAARLAIEPDVCREVEPASGP